MRSGPKLLLVGSGMKSYRGYSLEAFRRGGFRVTLLTQTAPDWEREYIDDAIVTDFSNVDAIREAVAAAHARSPFDGALTYIETNVELTASIIADLNLLGPTPEATHRCRDKLLTRRALRHTGLFSPECVEIDNQNLDRLANSFPFPAVLKPRRGYASINIVKVDVPQQLRPAWDLVHRDGNAAADLRREFLLEEYLDGPEFSLETAVANGRVWPVCVTDKHKSAEPYFEEVGHRVPASVPPEDAAEAAETVRCAVSALGLDNCVIHPELKRTSRGWAIVELNARLGGCKIPRLVELATGVDLCRAAADIAIGRFPTLQPTRDDTAAIGYFVPAVRQSVKTIPVPPQAEGLMEFEFWTAVGEQVAPPPDKFFTRLGYAIVVGRTPEQVEQRMRSVLDHVCASSGLSLVRW